jgi:hypothetical protein
MRFAIALAGAAVLLCAAAAQQVPADPDVARAEAGIQRLRSLVEAGALPRAQLQQAEDALADARDAAILRRLMPVRDLTEEQAGDMVAAAKRRLDRREKQLEKMRSMVDAGVAAKIELGAYFEEAGYARKEYELAVSRADLCREIAVMAREEQDRRAHPQPAPPDPGRQSVRFDGDGILTPLAFRNLENAFERRFSKPLPVSAVGETAVHRALGFDHRGRVDVAVSPDQPEGIWLRQYLESHRIPYFAFWHAVAGKATGAHIHIGPESTRLASARPGRTAAAAD